MARLVSKIQSENLITEGDIAVGIGFPLQPGTPIQNFTTAKQIHANLQNLILTMKGERPMQPTFGSDVYRLLFEPIYDHTLTQACREAIESAVEQWMPFVEVGLVEVDSDPDRNSVNIRVNYSVNGFEAAEALNVTVRV